MRLAPVLNMAALSFCCCCPKVVGIYDLLWIMMVVVNLVSGCTMRSECNVLV